MPQAVVGCAMALVGWLALAATCSALLQWQWGAALSDTLGVSALAGLAAWAALNLLHAAWQAWRDRAVIAAGSSAAAPADGARVVLVGVIEALGPTLRAPLDGSACVAYDYRISQYLGRGRHSRLVTHARGSALTPSVIVTRSGRHRLLTVPDLQGSEACATPADQLAAFRRHARSARFIGADAAAQELQARWTDDDGAYGSDVAYAPLEQLDLAQCLPTQQHIRPGAAVCAIGHYSVARGGLVPSPPWAASPQLIEGGADALLQKLGRRARLRLLLAVVAALVAAGLLAAFVADGAAGGDAATADAFAPG